MATVQGELRGVDKRLSLFFVVLPALAVVASCGGPACACATPPNTPGFGRVVAESQPTVAVGQVVRTDTKDELALRPWKFLKGSLPVDARGEYRFRSNAPSWAVQFTEAGIGVFVFGSDGLLAWQAKDDDYYRIGDYPLDVDEIVPLFDRQAADEVARVLQTADLVLVEREVSDGQLEPRVVSVFRGDASTLGTQLRVTSPDWWQTERTYDIRLGEVSARSSSGVLLTLERVAGGWITVPSWIEPGWRCGDFVTAKASAVFPEVPAALGCNTADGGPPTVPATPDNSTPVVTGP